MNNGTGADIKISKTQIRKVAKQGGSLFSTLAGLGARVLPYAVKGLSKAAPALAAGAVSALGSLGIDKIFGKGINIPKKFFPVLPTIVNSFTQLQIDHPCKKATGILAGSWRDPTGIPAGPCRDFGRRDFRSPP